MSEKTSVMMGKLVEAVGQVLATVEADEAMPESLRAVMRSRLNSALSQARRSTSEALAVERVVQAARPLDPAADWWRFAGGVN